MQFVELSRVAAWRLKVRRHPEYMPIAVIIAVWLFILIRPDAAMSLSFAGWVVMSIAMMGPASIPSLHHTAVNSLSWRRHRAMAEFATGYLAVWSMAGIVILALATRGAISRSPLVISATLCIATLWQFTPFKREAVRKSHRAFSLPLNGVAAEFAAIEFGARSGVACVVSCWPLMLVMTAAPSAHLAWLAAVTLLVTRERFTEHPRATMALHGKLLSLTAIASLILVAG